MRRSRNRGFTLLELMLVVSIIGVLSSFSIPYFVKAAARARRSEVSQVAQKIRLHFVNAYQSSDSTATGGFLTGVSGATTGYASDFNPGGGACTVAAGVPTNNGQPMAWDSSIKGWSGLPISFEGGLKLRYCYILTDPGSMQIIAQGNFPWVGQYTYVETLTGPSSDVIESPGF